MSEIPLPSNRSFGTVFTIFFALIAAYAFWKGHSWVRWPAGMSAIVLAVTIFCPNLLAPFNRLWMQLGGLLHRIVSPIVLGLIFFGIFAPVGWGMRRAGRDALKRRFEPHRKTYWEDRQPPGPPAEDLRNQF